MRDGAVVSSPSRLHPSSSMSRPEKGYEWQRPPGERLLPCLGTLITYNPNNILYGSGFHLSKGTHTRCDRNEDRDHNCFFFVDVDDVVWREKRKRNEKNEKQKNRKKNVGALCGVLVIPSLVLVSHRRIPALVLPASSKASSSSCRTRSRFAPAADLPSPPPRPV